MIKKIRINESYEITASGGPGHKYDYDKYMSELREVLLDIQYEVEEWDKESRADGYCKVYFLIDDYDINLEKGSILGTFTLDGWDEETFSIEVPTDFSKPPYKLY